MLIFGPHGHKSIKPTYIIIQKVNIVPFSLSHLMVIHHVARHHYRLFNC